MKFWVGSGLVDAHDAVVSALDHGFTVGDGVFETLKVVRSTGDPGGFVPFALTRHLQRLRISADRMRLACPDDEFLRTAVGEVLDASATELGDHQRMRITLSSGAGPAGSDRGDAGPTLTVTVSSGAAWPESTSIALVPWRRNIESPLVGVKSTSYAENVLALAAAKSAGASEAVLANSRGDLCEGTGSNIFVVVGGELVTPDLDSGPLAGITRALVCETMPVIERVVTMDEVAEADEVFLTSSTRDVHPVASACTLTVAGEHPFDASQAVDVRPLRTWEIGPVTRRAQKAFAALEASTLDP